MELDVIPEEPPPRSFWAFRVEELRGLPDDLDVLLRHRLLRSSATCRLFDPTLERHPQSVKRLLNESPEVALSKGAKDHAILNGGRLDADLDLGERRRLRLGEDPARVIATLLTAELDRAQVVELLDSERGLSLPDGRLAYLPELRVRLDRREACDADNIAGPLGIAAGVSDTGPYLLEGSLDYCLLTPGGHRDLAYGSTSRPPRGLHILLRHRPSSISPWPAGRQRHGFQGVPSLFHWADAVSSPSGSPAARTASVGTLPYSRERSSGEKRHCRRLLLESDRQSPPTAG